MRKESIDDECIDGNDGRRTDDGCEVQPVHWNPLDQGERVLQGVILEREMLVEGFDGVLGDEYDPQGSVDEDDQAPNHAEGLITGVQERSSGAYMMIT